MTRSSPIRLSQAAEADLAAIAELLRQGYPFPPSRGDALRYAVKLSRGYMEHLTKQGQPLPTIEQLNESA